MDVKVIVGTVLIMVGAWMTWAWFGTRSEKIAAGTWDAPDTYKSVAYVWLILDIGVILLGLLVGIVW